LPTKSETTPLACSALRREFGFPDGASNFSRLVFSGQASQQAGRFLKQDG
jgi:hypothetical protein